MDIRNWPLSQIMQLPDNCFGSRWVIGLCEKSANDVAAYDISEASLPDKCVIWFVTFWSEAQYTENAKIEVRLGDHLPANAAEFLAFEPLFSGIRDEDNHPSAFTFTADTLGVLGCMRMPVAAQGRRIVVQFINPSVTAVALGIIFIVSSMPTEVPDCLLSV